MKLKTPDPEKIKREYAINAIRELAVSLMWEDRKDDPGLSQEDMFDLVNSGKIPISEILVEFRAALEAALETAQENRRMRQLARARA